MKGILSWSATPEPWECKEVVFTAKCPIIKFWEPFQTCLCMKFGPSSWGKKIKFPGIKGIFSWFVTPEPHYCKETAFTSKCPIITFWEAFKHAYAKNLVLRLNENYKMPTFQLHFWLLRFQSPIIVKEWSLPPQNIRLPNFGEIWSFDFREN